MEDDDEEPKGASPLRRCIVTRVVRPKAEMLRFVVGPEGMVVPDIEERLPGRGIWLSAERDVVNTACAKGFFSKAAKANVRAPEGLADLVESLLARRCVELLGLARRAGQAVFGFEKVRARLMAGEAALVLMASDAAANGKGKLEGLIRDASLVAVLDGDEMGRASGRDRSVHVAIGPGRLADMLLREAGRLAGFRAA